MGETCSSNAQCIFCFIEMTTKIREKQLNLTKQRRCIHIASCNFYIIIKIIYINVYVYAWEQRQWSYQIYGHGSRGVRKRHVIIIIEQTRHK